MSVCQRGRACVWHSMSKWAAVRVPADYVCHRQRLKRVETDALSGSVESRAVVRRPTCGRRRWSFGGRLAWEFGREGVFRDGSLSVREKRGRKRDHAATVSQTTPNTTHDATGAMLAAGRYSYPPPEAQLTPPQTTSPFVAAAPPWGAAPGCGSRCAWPRARAWTPAVRLGSALMSLVRVRVRVGGRVRLRARVRAGLG